MSTQQPRTLLLVEDEALFRRLIVKHLTRQGHEVIETADAESALRAYYLQAFDAVITDVHLPGMSGLELGLAMRDIRPDQPIVFVTGDVDEKLANEALAQGSAGYLLKPFKFFELDAALRQSLASAVPGSSAAAPVPSGAEPSKADEDSWRIEQRRLLAAAASKPVELYVREAPSGPRAGTVPLLLRVLATLIVVLLGAWAVGYWIGHNDERADERGDPNAPGAGTIYVPTAPRERERERAPDRRPRNP